MSDVMLLGVLEMPFDDKGDLELIQIKSGMRQAAERIRSDRERIAELEGQLAEAQELLVECEKWPVWAKETDHLTWIAKVRAFIAAQAPQSSPDEPD